MRRTRDRSDRRRVVVALTGKLEKSIAPMFASLARRMLKRCGTYGDAQLASIHGFLSGVSRDIREETAKLTKLAEAE